MKLFGQAEAYALLRRCVNDHYDLTPLDLQTALLLIARLEKLDGNDEHPENRCDMCSGRNAHSWFADSDLWNRCARADAYSVLCPICFIERAKFHGIAPAAWRLAPADASDEVAHLQAQLREARDSVRLVAKRAVEECVKIVRSGVTDDPLEALSLGEVAPYLLACEPYIVQSAMNVPFVDKTEPPKA